MPGGVQLRSKGRSLVLFRYVPQEHLFEKLLSERLALDILIA